MTAAATSTSVRALPALSPSPTPAAVGGDDVDKEDVETLLEQHKDTRETITKLADRVDNAIRMGGENQAELFGGFGNLGLSQKVAALVESNKSTRRELRITRSIVRGVRNDVREELKEVKSNMKELRDRQLGVLERLLIAAACLSLFGWVVLQVIHEVFPQFFPGAR